MTREQLIREMIQIELLYQTRQKLLKEHEGSTVKRELNTSAEEKEGEKKEKIVTYEYTIGNNNSNSFVKFFNQLIKKIDLYNQYKDNKGNNIEEITKLTYDIIKNPINLNYGKTDKDINIIWGFFKEILTSRLLLPFAAAESLTEIFKSYDIAKNGRVFEIFEKDFPLQSLKYANAADINTIVEHLNDSKNVNNPLYQLIYNNKEKDENQTYSTGKGEFLCVLLTRGAISGGSTQLDISSELGGRSYDIKQTTSDNSNLNFTLSSKSGVRKFKNDFIKAYEKLSQKLYEISDELKKLGVDQNIINTIQNFKGYVGSSFKADSTTQRLQKTNTSKKSKKVDSTSKEYNIEIVDTPSKAAILPTYVSFGDITEALRQGLTNLRARSYSNSVQFNNIINNSLNNKYRNSQFDNNELQQKITIDINNNNINYTPINQIRNINSVDIDFLNNVLNLDITTFNTKADDFEKDDNHWFMYYNKPKSNANPQAQAPDPKFLFKIFKTEDYNDLLTKKIQNPYNKFFELDKDFPIIVLGAKSKITSASDITDFFDCIDRYINENNININNSMQFKIFKEIQSDISNKANVSEKKDSLQKYHDQLKKIIEDLFNNQILLTEDQMEKINNFITLNKQTMKNLTASSQKIVSNTVINDEYVVAEPLQQTDNDGEFIIDISFYKNKKKRHIDTLHSQDFKIKNSTNQQITKANKSAEIKNIDPNKIVQNVNIELDDVISDKKMIDQKLKQFNLFNTLQPGILDTIFLKDPNNLNQYRLKPLTDSQGNSIGTDVNEKEIKEVSKSLNKKFMEDLKDVKEKTKEENILNILCDLYVAIDELETQVMEYYYDKNDVIVINENKKKYTNAINWGAETFNDQYSFEVGFITDINNEGVICNADPAKKSQTIKQIIRETFRNIIELMLDVQMTIRK
jgi:hypothetical protein